MSTQQKITIGGIGALAPILMNLLVFELSTTLAGITLIVVISYLVRVTVLFFIGGLVAYLHKDENSPLKIFELGIMAPALIMAFMNGSKIPVMDANSVQIESYPNVEGSLLLPGMLLARESIPDAASFAPQPSDSAKQDSILNELNVFMLPRESTIEQVQRGLLGSAPKRVHFVVVGKDTSHSTAKALAKELLKGKKGYIARIYAPFRSDLFYSIVIGSNLTYEEAMELRARAIKDGFPKETDLWTFPKK